MEENRIELTGLILAGGRSSRMGKNKAFLEVNGRPVIERVIQLFRSLFREVKLVTNTPSEYAHLHIDIVQDIFPWKGPLGGIYTGLISSTCSHSFIVTCDMPFLREGLVRHLTGLRGNFDVVVPRTTDGYEPLHAVYSKNCINPAEAAIRADRLRIIDIYPMLNVREVSVDEIAALNPEPSSFLNINTPEDYAAAAKAYFQD